MSNQTTNPSSPAGASSATAVASPSFFMPPMDPSTGTWLSLGSYEEVFNSDWDYWAIHKALKADGMTLVKILRIHNNILKDRLEAELILVKKGRKDDFDPNVQDLYHGTSESLERICHEGLDGRLATSGHFGRGLYFSDSPAICRIQSESSSPKMPFIVRCRVILGDCKIYPPGQSDPSLTREPIKEAVDGKHVFYDSVKGKTGNFNQFVVYEKRRAMIQYVIYYTTDSALPSLPPIPQAESRSRKKKKKDSEKSMAKSPQAEAPSVVRPSASNDVHVESYDSSSSVDSAQSSVSSPSSGDSCSDEEDSSRLGAVGGLSVRRNPPFEGSRNQENLSQQEQTGQTSGQTSVPKVKSTRDRTRCLMSEDAPFDSATSGAAASSSVGAALGPDPASVSIYKKKMQEAAMKHMLDLKGRVPPSKISELWEDYSRTYGSETLGDIEEHFSASASADNEDVEVVTDVLVEEFRQIVPSIEARVARQYIIQNGMDLNRAMSAYFESG